MKYRIIATAINSLVAYKAMSNQKVVILPPVADHKIAIRGNDADDEYLKMMGRYLTRTSSITLTKIYLPAYPR